MNPSEVSIQLQGRMLAGKHWQRKGCPRVLALHGWLDNANSFDLIAPELANLDIFALDFAGHGLSDFRPEHTPYIAMLDVQDVMAVANHLGWDQFSLIGHSMGAEVGTHLIGLYPDRVDKFLALDGFAETISQEKWQRLHRESIDVNLTKQAGSKRVFAEQTEMARAVAGFTGQTLSSASTLVERGTQAVEGGFIWRSDPRVRWSDAMGIPREQMDHHLAGFDGQILVVCAESGLDWYRDDLVRLEAQFSNFSVQTVPGTHHLHMDDDTTVVSDLIRKFFEC